MSRIIAPYYNVLLIKYNLILACKSDLNNSIFNSTSTTCYLNLGYNLVSYNYISYSYINRYIHVLPLLDHHMTQNMMFLLG